MAKARQYRRPIEESPARILPGSDEPRAPRLRHMFSEPGVAGFIRSILVGDQRDGEMRDPVREETRVYAAITLIGDAAASVPLRVYDRDPGKDDEAQLLPESDPVSRLFEHWNPMMDPSESRERVAHGMEITGGSFLIMTKANGLQVPAADKEDLNSEIELPDEFWPVSQKSITPITDEGSGLPRAWRMRTAGGKTKVYDASSLLHIKYSNPNGGFMGMAPLDVAIWRARQIHKARVYQDAILESGGDPGGIIIAKSKLNPEARDRLEQMVEEQWNDGTEVGDTRLLYGDVEYHPNPIGPKEMQYRDLTEVNWQAISEVFRVPPTLLGLRSANFAEHLLHLRTFWKLKMLSLFRRIESALNSRFFPRLRDPRQQQYRVKFDTDAVEALQDELADKAEVAEKIQKLGVPLNLALQIAGIDVDPIQGGDTPLVPSTLQPLEGIEERAQRAPSPPEPSKAAGAVAKTDDERATRETVEDSPSSVCASTGAQGAVSPSEVPGSTPPGDGVGERAGSGTVPPLRSEGEQRSEGEGGEDPDVDAEREAYLRRRAYDRSTQARREPSNKRIAAKVRRWNRKLKPAQIAHLDKVAKGRKKLAGFDEPYNPKRRGPMSDAVAEAFLEARRRDLEAELGPADWGAMAGKRLAESGSFGPATLAWSVRNKRFARLPVDEILYLAHLTRAKITEKELDRLILSVSKSKFWIAELEDEARDAFFKSFEEAAAAIAAELDEDPLDVTASQAQKYIKEKLFKVSEGTNSVLAKDLRKRFAKLFAESDATGTLAERLRDILPGAKSEARSVFGKTHRRAKLIARTETGQIDSHVREQAMKGAGVEKHEWITSGLDNVRESHEENDGKVRKIDGGTFPAHTGPPLKRAHDPDGHPSEIINCACVMAPVLE